MKWAPNALPIPIYCADRPLFKGMVIPFVTHIAEDGTPDFRINAYPKIWEAALKSLCGICGKKLGSRAFFIGGERSTRGGRFLDPPMHEACARYAASVCPFLVGATDYAPLRPTKDGQHVEKLEGTVTDRTKMFFTCTRDYGYDVVNDNGTVLFTVNSPQWTEKFWEKASV